MIESHQLIVTGLSCQVGRSILFKDLSFTIESGQWLEVTGNNGAGKSTLLRAVAGLSDPISGDSRIVLGDSKVNTDLRRILYQGHKQSFNDQLSAFENLHWQAQLDASAYKITKSLLTAVDDALRIVDLYSRRDIAFGRLSAGQKRRCTLARLAICNQALQGIKLCWALDEPLTALDAQGQALLTELINQHLSQGGSAVFCTHQSLQFVGLKVRQTNAAQSAAKSLNLSAIEATIQNRLVDAS